MPWPRRFAVFLVFVSRSYTQHFRDFAAHASANGLRFDLRVRPTTQMAGRLRDAIEAGAINRRIVP